MSQTFEIPTTEIPSATRFSVKGQSFQLDVLEWIYSLNDLSEEVNKTAAPDADKHRLYLERFVEMLKEQCGVTLSMGEADWLNDHLAVLYQEAKKKRKEAFDAVRLSPSSTDSIPAD